MNEGRSIWSYMRVVKMVWYVVELSGRRYWHYPLPTAEGSVSLEGVWESLGASQKVGRRVCCFRNSFLIEKERLSRGEQRAQRVFALMPWLTFGVMLVAPYYVTKWALATRRRQCGPE